MTLIKKTVVFIIAGGTAGHVYPALETSNSLYKLNVEVINITDQRAKKLYKNIDKLYTLNITSFSYKSPFRLFRAMMLMSIAAIKSIFLIIKLKPICVIGFGGYPSAPMCLASVLMFKPLYLHEQNSVLGKVNRMFSSYAKKVFTAFPDTKGGSSSKKYYIGTPTSSKFKYKKYNESKTNKTHRLLITGGSLGARIFSDIIPKMVAIFPRSFLNTLDILHQAPSSDLERLTKEYTKLGVKYKVSSFFEEMDEHLNWCHLYIGRAGGLTTSELMQVGRPSILVPLPFAADNHQYFNAEYLYKNKAAIIINQKKLTPSILAETVENLFKNKSYLNLNKMALAASKLAVKNSGNTLANLILTDNQQI